MKRKAVGINSISNMNSTLTSNSTNDKHSEQELRIPQQLFYECSISAASREHSLKDF